MRPGWDLEQEVSQYAVLCRDVTGVARQTRAARHGQILPGLLSLLPSPPHSMPCGCLIQALLQSCPWKQRTGHNRGFVPPSRRWEGPWKDEEGAGIREGFAERISEGSFTHRGLVPFRTVLLSHCSIAPHPLSKELQGSSCACPENPKPSSVPNSSIQPRNQTSPK